MFLLGKRVSRGTIQPYCLFITYREEVSVWGHDVREVVGLGSVLHPQAQHQPVHQLLPYNSNNQFVRSCPTTTTTSSSAPALQQQQPVRQLLPYNNNQFISSWPGYLFLNNIFLITLMLKFKSNHQENLENINLHIFFYLLVLYFWVQGSIIHTI